MRPTLPLLLLLLLPPLAALPARAGDVVVKAVHIVSQINDNLPTDESKCPEKRDKVTLHAVVEAEVAGQPVFLTNAGRFQLNGKIYEGNSVGRWNRNRHGVIHLRWSKIEWDRRKHRSYDNTAPAWHWAKIDYATTEWQSGNHKRFAVKADCIPSFTLERADLGTMRFKVEAEHEGQVVSSPGVEHLYHGGAKDAVHRISRKGATGTSLLDWAFAHCNLPYIWGSAGTTDADHQSERFVGADCADLCVAAARRAGMTWIPFGSTKTMKQYADTLCEAKFNPATGRFINAKTNKPIRFGKDVRPGDLIFGHRHVGYLTRDLGEQGILDRNDTVLHTLFEAPRERPLSDVQLFAQGFEVLRFKAVKPLVTPAPAAAPDRPGVSGGEEKPSVEGRSQMRGFRF